MSAGTELGACTFRRSDVLHAVRSTAMPSAGTRRREKVLYVIGMPLLVNESDTDHDRRELRVFGLIRADSVAHPTRRAETVLGVESRVFRPGRQVAAAD